MIRLGETIDRYRVEDLIGQGGMAAVYRARHVQLDSEHAIKVLFITAPSVRERLLREGRVQANLRHPNIVSVTDVLEVLGAPALVMEYVDGPALDSWLVANKPTLDEALWLFRGVLRGIGAAHEGGVVHRDLKPANVLLAPTNDGLIPKITDFGLVKSISEQEGNTQSGMALGTPEYMSPEQIRDASDVDQRADMWALGCLLYELVCHRRAFSGPDKMSTFNRIVAGTYEPPSMFVDDLPQNVDDAIRALLEVDREKRLSSCEELCDLLYRERDTTTGRLAAPQRRATPLLVAREPSFVDTAPLPSPKKLREKALANVPTYIPAIRRSATPIGLRGERPPPHAAAVRLQPRSLGAAVAVIAMLLAAIVGVSIVATSSHLLGSEPTDVAATAPTLAETVQRDEPVPAPSAPAPKPVVPEPAVVEPAPSKRDRSPQKPPPPEIARVSVVGVSADDVWLVLGGQRHRPGEDLRPGRYLVEVRLGDEEPADAGALDLRAGDEVMLSCDGYLRTCKAL